MNLLYYKKSKALIAFLIETELKKKCLLLGSSGNLKFDILSNESLMNLHRY